MGHSNYERDIDSRVENLEVASRLFWWCRITPRLSPWDFLDRHKEITCGSDVLVWAPLERLGPPYVIGDLLSQVRLHEEDPAHLLTRTLHHPQHQRVVCALQLHALWRSNTHTHTHTHTHTRLNTCYLLFSDLAIRHYPSSDTPRHYPSCSEWFFRCRSSLPSQTQVYQFLTY